MEKDSERWPLCIITDSIFVVKIVIQLLIVGPKFKKSNTLNNNFHDNESNAFANQSPLIILEYYGFLYSALGGGPQVGP